MVNVAFASNFYEAGDQGEEIALIQTRLLSLGYAAGSADGDFGPATEAAVKAYQRDQGLAADGVVGPATYKMLLGRDIPAVSRDASTAVARRIIQFSMRYLGVPYLFGGTTPAGFDCSGFTRYVYGTAGLALPRAADDQFGVGRAISMNRLQPGDLVFFSTYAPGASHSGIYIGDGSFISATSSRGIAVDRISSSYWGPRYIGARRVL
ncbi:MAG: NlpC/P60 family protein [Sporomusaceae bacterium]|nr:NlpC/P60 family protein [Sporomusaceae bacterium]